METVDLTKVAGFKALDSDGNELGIVSMEQLTDSIAMRIADGLSERTVLPANNVPMAVAATSTGSDKMETAFSETTDPAYVRVIDKNGNSAKQGISSLATVVGGLIGIETLQLSKLVSYSAKIGDGTYKLIDKSTSKGTFRFVYLEDRYEPFIFYISRYDQSYKSEYRVNKILSGTTSTSSLKFIYDVEGNIYFQKTGGSRGSILSIQLVAGFATITIEKVDSVDGTEITVS